MQVGKPKKSIIIIIITDIINIKKIHDFKILQGKHGIVLCALEYLLVCNGGVVSLTWCIVN